MILCLLNQQQTCPGEQMPHVSMYGHGDRASVTQGRPIEGEETQCHLECCFFGIATTKERIVGLIHLAIGLRHTYFHLTLLERPESHAP